MRKSKEVNLVAVFTIALIIVLIGAYVGYCYYMHISTLDALAQGYIEEADAYSRRDPFFSSREKQIVSIRGLLDEGLETEAEAMMNLYPQEPVVQQMRKELYEAQDARCYEEAWELLNAGELEAAERRMSKLHDPDGKDTAPFYEILTRTAADEFLLAGEYDQALAAYRKLPQLSADAEILAALETGDDLKAAQLAAEAGEQNTSLLEQERWMKLFTKKEENTDRDDLEGRLVAEACLACFQTPEPLDNLGERIRKSYSEWWWPWILDKFSGIHSGKYLCAVSAVDELLDACGSAPGGKILVLYQQDMLPDHSPVYAVDLDLMRHLPQQYLPTRLAEVEYVIWIVSSYQDAGSYWIRYESTGEGMNVKGVRLTGSARCLTMPDKTELYRSQTVVGGSQMETHFNGADWVSGTEPLLSDVLAAAFNAIPTEDGV